MEISLRSRMTAGTFAVVGATAIAVTPMAQPALISSAQREASSAMVALTGFNNPISDLISTVNVASNYLFSGATPALATDGHAARITVARVGRWPLDSAECRMRWATRSGIPRPCAWGCRHA